MEVEGYPSATAVAAAAAAAAASSIVLTSTLKNDKVLTSNPSQFDIEIGTIWLLKNIEEKKFELARCAQKKCSTSALTRSGTLCASVTVLTCLRVNVQTSAPT